MKIRITEMTYKTILLYVFFIAAVYAENYPDTLEELEQYEAVKLVDESAASDQVTSRTMLQQFNLHVMHTKLACIKAVGHESFCDCISENMPANQEFANYVVAVSKTKSELNFSKLSEYYQQSIDLARSARDKCVTETM